MSQKPEVWQRGPIPDIAPLLQPVAHALLQAQEEVIECMTGFREHLLWICPSGMASAGFHLQHLSGVLDRIFTYARAEALSEGQFEKLREETTDASKKYSVNDLVSRFEKQVELAIQQLKETDEAALTDYRGIGRSALPSTVIGLLFHAAEHTMRHLGQLLVTVAVVSSGEY